MVQILKPDSISAPHLIASKCLHQVTANIQVNLVKESLAEAEMFVTCVLHCLHLPLISNAKKIFVKTLFHCKQF